MAPCLLHQRRKSGAKPLPKGRNMHAGGHAVPCPAMSHGIPHCDGGCGVLVARALHLPHTHGSRDVACERFARKCELFSQLLDVALHAKFCATQHNNAVNRWSRKSLHIAPKAREGTWTPTPLADIARRALPCYRNGHRARPPCLC